VRALPRLKADELLLALDVVREVQAAPDLDAYRHAVLRLRELIPCTEVGYNEVDAETGELRVMIMDPPDSPFPGIVEAFSRSAHQHPVIRHHAATGEVSAKAISDFLSEDELHSLDLYKDVYAVLGAEDQISFILPSPPEMVVGVAMNRASRGFSASDRELIELVRPHLSQAFRDAQLRERTDPLSQRNLEALGLTDREAEVMRLVVEGRSASEIADELVISIHTARRHIANSYERLGVRNRAAAVAALLRGSGSGSAPLDGGG
jgi:DNA-binding CsgD family transcriptional regulator